MKHFAIIFLAAAVLAGSAGAAESVSGLFMLKSDHGARPAGMGAAFASIAADPNAVAYNPAASAGLTKFTASFGHTEYWDNIRLESGYFGMNLSSRTFLHGGIRFGIDDDIEKRGLVPTTEPDALFDAHDVSFKGGVSYRFNEKLSAGASMGWFLQEIEGYRGSAFNIDLGAIYAVRPNLSLGAAITSLGPDFNITKSGQPGSDDISLPTTYRLGGSYTYLRYLGSADIVILDDDFHMHFGAETAIRENFRVRAGYMAGYDTKSFTAGASFLIQDLAVDYAFLPFSNNLGTSHLFNLTFSL